MVEMKFTQEISFLSGNNILLVATSISTQNIIIFSKTAILKGMQPSRKNSITNV